MFWDKEPEPSVCPTETDCFNGQSPVLVWLFVCCRLFRAWGKCLLRFGAAKKPTLAIHGHVPARCKEDPKEKPKFFDRGPYPHA